MASRLSISTALGTTYFRGRTALVTGASSGIGRDCAITLLRMGAKVALLARRRELLEGLVDELATKLADTGRRPLVMVADVTDPDAARVAVAEVLSEFGHLDILVNSAGVLSTSPVASMPLETLERMMRVNLYGTLNMLQAVLPSMRTAGTGSIVNVGSLARRRGIPELGGY
jgi:NAD(P)-dependent dehydrogenase (short-subunit alcohol dehydrogenase family)